MEFSETLTQITTTTQLVGFLVIQEQSTTILVVASSEIITPTIKILEGYLEILITIQEVVDCLEATLIITKEEEEVCSGITIIPTRVALCLAIIIPTINKAAYLEIIKTISKQDFLTIVKMLKVRMPTQEIST